MVFDRLRLAVLALTFVGSSASAQLSFDLPGFGRVSIDNSTIVQAATNPFGFVNPTAIPTQGDFIQTIVSNPEAIITIVQNPQYAAYYPLASQMTAARNSIIANGGRPIPPDVRAALSPFYPSSLLDSVRWSTDWNIVQNAPVTAMMFGNRNLRAVTFINAIVFRNGEEAGDFTLWAHELFHVQQYQDWGVLEFAKRWTDNSSVTGPVEGPAYDMERQARTILNSRSQPLGQVMRSAGVCESKNASMAVCDLYVNARQGPLEFTVTGTARASSDGTRNGRMWFVISTNGRACNSGSSTEYMVDNATELSGPSFECKITVQPGTLRRVFLVAPNRIATAQFTRAQVTFPTVPGAW